MGYNINESKHLTDAETKVLLESMTKVKATNPRDYFMILLALHTGARARELLGLTKASINGRNITVKGNKGSNDRTVPISRRLALELTSWLQGIDGRLFNISYQRLNKIWDWYRPVPKPFHSLRHTAAIHAFKRSKNIVLVKYMLGHRAIASTMVYAEYVFAQTELNKITR